LFFNFLGLGEFLALFTAASALVVALYLLDRSRRSVMVATLRFWNEARRPVESTRRRRIRQWPSLLLQLVSIACLLAALSQLRLGSRDTDSLDHVLVLDTSAWMSASAGGTPLINGARTQALSWLRAIPATDRVLVMYADALATPATGFETDRRKIARAIAQAQPGHSALDLAQSLDYARRLQQRTARRIGEIVFAGAARIESRGGTSEIQAPPNLRLLPAGQAGENVGLRKLGLRQSSIEPGIWNVYVSAKNYGMRLQTADLAVRFGGAPVATRRLAMPANSEQEIAFEVRTRASGILEARIRASGDTFVQDDHAQLELPSVAGVSVTVCTDEPQLLRPLLESHPNLRPTFLATAQCAASPREGLVIYDRFSPAAPPSVPSLYIEPPGPRSPVAIRGSAANVTLRAWNASHPLAYGLRVQDLRLSSVQILAPGEQQTVVAESEAGPLVVAAASGTKHVVYGFHPTKAGLRFELATPLLFANTLRWLAPESFRNRELYASSVGTVTIPLENNEDSRAIRVLASNGSVLPFSVQEKSLRFFSGKPGTVRVQIRGAEQVHALTLPDVPDSLWMPPATVRRGVPAARQALLRSRDLWQWLALLGGLGLLIEWLLFAPASHAHAPAGGASARSAAEQFPLRRAS
jgi:hypothetical protein